MRIVKLDKLFTVGTEYTAERYRAYVIEEIGTDDTADVTPVINAEELGVITNKITPLHQTNSNLFTLLNLRELKYVVPPDYTLKFTGTSGKLVRCRGRIYLLEPGEALPAELMDRFHNQKWHHFKTIYGAAVSTGTSWADGAEISLYSLTPTTIETYILNHRAGCEQVAAGSPAETDGDVGVRILIDDSPLDILKTTMGRLGLGRTNMPLPPAETTENQPFSFCDSPVTVLPNHELEVKAINVSGGILFGTTAAEFKFWAVAEYKKEKGS